MSRSHVHSEPHITESPDQPASDPIVDKTHESIHQVQPDSVPFTVHSDGGREDSNHDHNFVHSARAESSTEYQRDKKTKINFPKTNDTKAWKDLDLILSDTLPAIFNRNRIKSENIDKLIDNFDEFLHAFFLEHCGVEDDPICDRPAINVSKQHRGLERLRKQKNDCKKALKALKKAGLDKTEAGKM